MLILFEQHIKTMGYQDEEKVIRIVLETITIITDFYSYNHENDGMGVYFHQMAPAVDLIVLEMSIGTNRFMFRICSYLQSSCQAAIRATLAHLNLIVMSFIKIQGKPTKLYVSLYLRTHIFVGRFFLLQK